VDPELVKGTLSLLILSLLTRKPMYGYEMAATVHAETDGAFEWKEGSLYPSLHNLERAGLVSSQWEGEAGSRRRKYYYLTEAGRSALATKTLSWRKLCQAIDQVLEGHHGAD
jgi:transcriptional regulator